MHIAFGVGWSMGVLMICLVSARDQRKKITTSVPLLRLPRVTVLLLGCRLTTVTLRCTSSPGDIHSDFKFLRLHTAPGYTLSVG